MFRFLGGHLMVGSLAAAVVLTALLAGDTFGLASLAGRDPAGGLAIALLGFGLWITFGSLALGAGIMGMRRGERPSSGGGWRFQGTAAPIPVRVRSGSRSSR